MKWSDLLKLLPALIELVRFIVGRAERATGKAEAHAEIDADTKKRVEAAEAAARDADALNADPSGLRDDDSFRRPD